MGVGDGLRIRMSASWSVLGFGHCPPQRDGLALPVASPLLETANKKKLRKHNSIKIEKLLAGSYHD